MESRFGSLLLEEQWTSTSERVQETTLAKLLDVRGEMDLSVCHSGHSLDW